LLLPERNEAARLLGKHRTSAVIPDDVIRAPDFFVEWHLGVDHSFGGGAFERCTLYQPS
jgi:hypothetical protein